MTDIQKKYLTVSNLKQAGNKRITKRLYNHKVNLDDKLYELSKDLFYLYEDLEYLIEHDEGWSKTYRKAYKNYKQCCKITLRYMKKGK